MTCMQQSNDNQLDRLTAHACAYADAHRVGYIPLTTPVTGLDVIRSPSPTKIMPVMYEPVFCLVLQGAKQAVAGDRVVTFGRMESLIVSTDLPAVTHIVWASRSAPYVALALQLNTGIVHELIHEEGVRVPEGERNAIVTLPKNEMLLDAMSRLFGLIDQPQAIPVLRPLIVREIHYRLLQSGQGAMLADLANTDSHAARIARVIGAIKRRFDDTLTTDELAGIASMSRSALHEHFRAVTGATPLQFQKQLRLFEARQLLRQRHYSVAGAAFEVGYESPAQFSREYARQFGASPRHDKSNASTHEERVMPQPQRQADYPA